HQQGIRCLVRYRSEGREARLPIYVYADTRSAETAEGQTRTPGKGQGRETTEGRGRDWTQAKVQRRRCNNTSNRYRDHNRWNNVHRDGSEKRPGCRRDRGVKRQQYSTRRKVAAPQQRKFPVAQCEQAHSLKQLRLRSE